MLTRRQLLKQWPVLLYRRWWRARLYNT